MEAENFVNVFESGGKFLFEFFNNVDSMYAATFIFFTVLVYGILLALIGQIPAFGDKKPNKHGKLIAFVISIISSIALFRIDKERQAVEVVTSMLKGYAIFAGAVIALLFFAIIYFGLGNKKEEKWHLGVIGAGFFMAIAGYYISTPMVQVFGWIIGIIGIILYIWGTGLLTEASKESEK